MSQQAPKCDLDASIASSANRTPQDVPMSCRLLHTLTHYEIRSTGETCGFITDNQSLALLHEVYSVFMQEIVAAMAGIRMVPDVFYSLCLIPWVV